jgi:hypothetical protein
MKGEAITLVLFCVLAITERRIYLTLSFTSTGIPGRYSILYAKRLKQRADASMTAAAVATRSQFAIGRLVFDDQISDIFE